MNLYFCDHHHFPLPVDHKFPLRKYRLVRDLLAKDRRFRFSPAPLAKPDELMLVHDCDYVAAFLAGTLAREAIRRIGLPWSEGLVARTLASVGGTLAATEQALSSGIGGTLAGGTHHAFRAEGAGFCVFNDIAVAIEWARRQRGGPKRLAVLDLDVHQGDGTAAIFLNDTSVFTISLHGEKNFPFRKQRSWFDYEFHDAATGTDYLPAVEKALQMVKDLSPDLLFFQSGVDSLASDRLGRLALTKADLAERDRLVFEYARTCGVPIVITMGGGYSEPIELTAEAHCQTFRIAADLFFR